MKKKIIACSLLGMNRLSSSDITHPFEMSKLFSRYPDTTFLPQVSEIEKTYSTLFYEVMTAFSNLETKSDDIKFIFSRGTLGTKTEKAFLSKLEEAYSQFGDDSFVVIVAKSYGGVDTLRTLKKIKNVKVDLLILIDSTAPIWSTLGISKLSRMFGKLERIFTIPDCVKEVWNVNQKYDTLKGKSSDRGENFTITHAYLNSHDHIYNKYSDGYNRVLKVEHDCMEEICSVVPVFKYKSGMIMLEELIQLSYLNS